MVAVTDSYTSAGARGDDLGQEPASHAPPPAIYARTIPADRLDADAVKVLRRLRRNGHTSYLVGGGVRDLLLGRHPKDFDVATSARPQDVRRLFRNCRVIGRRFRLAHILFAENKIIECATFRRDPEQEYEIVPLELTAGASSANESGAVRLVPCKDDHAEDADLLIRHDNHFGEPHEDAIRRDFTINGLFYDITRGEVIDYVGGMADLERRVVRTIGDPGVRFREDPVRILRAIKFSARLDMGIAPEVYDAMVEHRGELARAAKPRVFEELLRLMRGGAAHRSIYLAWDIGVLAEILPEVACYLDDGLPDTDLTWKRLAAIDRRHAEDALPSDAVLLASLLYGPVHEALEDARDLSSAFEEFMEEVAVRLAIPRRMKERMSLLMLAQRRLHQNKPGSLARRDFFPEAAELYAIDCEAAGREVPEWVTNAAAQPIVPDDGEGGRRRRRRRRRRRSDIG